MFDFIQNFFATDDFMPHGMCYLWRPDMVALHVVSDAMIAIAYFTIPVFLYTFARKKKGVAHIYVFHLFAAFIMLCGLTHVMGIWVLWNPDYGTQGLLKLMTGVVSVVTAILVWVLLPTLLKLPTTAELEEANSRLDIFRRVLDAAQIGVLINKTRRLGGEIIFVNPAYADMVGYSEEELIGQHIDKFTEQVFYLEGLDPLLDGIANGERASSIVTTCPRGGEQFQNEISMAPVTGADGAFTHWVSFNSDVTERIEREDTLAENEELFRAAFETTPQGIALLTIEGKWIRVNQALCNMLGYTEEELQETDFQSLTHPADLDSDMREVRRLLKGEIDSYEMEKRYICKDRSIVPALLSVGLARDRAGNPLRFVSQVFDLRELKKAEREVQQAKRLYEAIERNTDIAIFVEDMTGMFGVFEELRANGVTDILEEIRNDPVTAKAIGHGIVLQDCNDAGLKLLGAKTTEEVFEFGFFKRPETQRSVGPMLKALFEMQETARGEATFKTIDGREISCVYSLPVPRSLEEASYVPLLVVEVSELRKAQAAEAASKAKSEFLATMSHEIRSPLNAILGNIELVGMRNLDTETDNLVREASMASKSLLALIGNILDFSKIEAGALTMEARPMNPVNPLHETVEICMVQARSKNVGLSYAIAADLPRNGIGDESRLRQILINLIGNAIKFTDNGGVFTSISVDEWRDDTCVMRFDVIDSGVGFNEDSSGRLFQPFAQNRADEGAMREGTGLGLTIARTLVERVGGEISCAAIPGKGAHFWFTWPLPKAEPPQNAKSANLKGLLVDVVTHPNANAVISYFESRQATVRVTEPDGSADDETLPDIRVGFAMRGETLPDIPADMIHSTIGIAVLEEISANEIRSALAKGYAYPCNPSKLEAILDRNLPRLIEFEAQGGHGKKASGTASRVTDALNGKHLLVLEDRPANQMVIRRQLTSLGISCTIADNGESGLSVLASGEKFDAVLCDCSMPVMDGFAFTEELRRREKEDTAPRLAVIALTANAFREDVERCMAAGMDDFISKPVSRDNLAATLARWTEKKPSENSRDAAVRKVDDAIDLAAISELLGDDDPEGIAMILQQLKESAPKSLNDVADAAASGDGAGLVKATHAAKGEALNCGAPKLADLYLALEQDAKRGNVGNIDKRLAEIRAEVGRVVAAADTHVAS